MKLRALICTSVLLVGGSLATAGVAPTTLGTLQDLINSGATGVTIGDKTFYNFSYQGVASGGPQASAIMVTQAPGPDLGLRFSFQWTATDGETADSVIQYFVHVNDTTPTQREITSVGLSQNSTILGSSLATHATVTETVATKDGTILGNFSTFDAGPAFSALNRLSSTFAVSPTRDLFLTKDISVTAAVGDDTATISSVDNTFQQTPGGSSVPVPAAGWMGLSTLLLGAFAPIRRRVRAIIGVR